MICAKCNANIADNAKFCNKCGEKVDKSKGAGDTITCVECKAAYPKTVKFCKKDGTRLDSAQVENTELSEKSSEAPPEAVEIRPVIAEKEIKAEIEPELPVAPLPEAVEAPQFEPYQQVSMADSMPEKSRSKMPLLFALLGLGILIIGSGVGSYFYFLNKSMPAVNKTSALPSADESKTTPETAKDNPSQPEPPQIKPGKLAKLINRDLKSKGLGRIYASVNSKLVVTLKGSANSSDEKTRAMNIAGMYKEAKEVKDNIHVKEKSKPFTASPEPKTPTPQPAAPRPAPISPAPVKSVPKPSERPRINDPALLASEINRALQNAGLRFVTASVTDNYEIYLMGMVRSSSEREKALRIARSFREGRKVIDQMMNNY